MKKKMLISALAVMLVAGVLMSGSYAAASDGIVGYAVEAYQDEDIPIGSSNEVTMVGTVEPTIMSVTMPTYVPFHISRSVQGDNKVISPRINIINNSSIPVSLDVVYTAVDLSRLPGAAWAIGPVVDSNQIAIGLQPESLANQMPTTLEQTRWLVDNMAQNVNIISLSAYDSSAIYVVGTLGSAVPENESFTVTPTFVVREA